MEHEKKIIFSATQPSGKITLGNYLGALRNWVSLQEDYHALYCVADEHAITVRQDPAALRRQTLELYAQFIACGLDPEKSTIFIQSHVPQHAELAWTLNCYTMYGELSRMTQFKDKSAAHADNVNAGLFTYPSLMAADILLYQTDLVPVGEDQRQHVELTRNIAQRFNGIYGEVFTMPEAYIPKVAARVMSLSEPDKKMSKSSTNENSYILVMDPPEVILRKFKRAVTDSEGGVYRSPDKPGVSNLIEIYAAVTGKSPEAVEQEFSGQGYGAFKPAVGEAVVEALRPIREETQRLLADKAYLESLYRQGAEKAAAMEGLISEVKAKGDTIGGIITGVIRHCPIGLGEPVYGKLHAALGGAMLGINAVKGFEYGRGFAGVSQRGSEQNDVFIPQNGAIGTRTNHSGGIQGGISNGQDIYFRVAFKPVATILMEQETVTLDGTPTIIKARGRHDACVLPRAVPVVEAMAAMTILDYYLLNKTTHL